MENDGDDEDEDDGEGGGELDREEERVRRLSLGASRQFEWVVCPAQTKARHVSIPNSCGQLELLTSFPELILIASMHRRSSGHEPVYWALPHQVLRVIQILERCELMSYYI